MPQATHRKDAERWLGPRVLASARMLELSSYHAIVACVAAGTGVAIIPESVLDAVQSTMVMRHPLPKVFANVMTPLAWRGGEDIQSVRALLNLAQEHARRRRNPRATPAQA